MEKYQHKVQYYETDKMQFTHHSNYIRFMEEARIDFFDQLGWGYDKMEKEGIISPVTAIICDYKKSTGFLDVIDIQIQILKITATRLTIGYVMNVGETLVCQATSEHCFLDVNGRPLIIKKHYPILYQLLEELVEEQL